MGPEAEMVAHCAEGHQGPDEDGEVEGPGRWTTADIRGISGPSERQKQRATLQPDLPADGQASRPLPEF